MQRLMINLLVTLTTLGFGIVAASFLAISNQPEIKMPDLQKPEAQAMTTEAFTSTSGMSVKTDRGCINSNTYRAADGTQVSTSHEIFGSPSKAVKEMRTRLKDAEQIVERVPVKNESGKRIGERVVMLWRYESTGCLWAVIMWTDGSQLNWISSESMPTALEFERYKNEYLSFSTE